jgi:GNAT superfamily N-acetyltransferase
MTGRQITSMVGAESLRLGTGNVVVKRGGLADVGDIARFQTRAWQLAYQGMLRPGYLESLSATDAEDEWRGYIESGTRQIVLARASDELVGVASWGPADVPAEGVPDLELKSIYLAPSVQGTGLAALLLEKALERQSAHLWMFDGNARADAFYRKNGFAPDGGRLLDEAAGAWELRYVR